MQIYREFLWFPGREISTTRAAGERKAGKEQTGSEVPLMMGCDFLNQIIVGGGLETFVMIQLLRNVSCPGGGMHIPVHSDCNVILISIWCCPGTYH